MQTSVVSDSDIISYYVLAVNEWRSFTLPVVFWKTQNLLQKRKRTRGSQKGQKDTPYVAITSKRRKYPTTEALEDNV